MTVSLISFVDRSQSIDIQRINLPMADDAALVWAASSRARIVLSVVVLSRPRHISPLQSSSPPPKSLGCCRDYCHPKFVSFLQGNLCWTMRTP